MNNRVMMMLKRSVFRTFHLRGLNYSLLCSDNRGGISANQEGLFSTISCVNYGLGRDIKNSNDHHHHRRLPLLLASSSKATHPQQHFCTRSGTTTSNVTSSSSDQTIVNKLPDSIDQQCEEWAQILHAEWEHSANRHIWHATKLRCTNVFTNLNSSKLFLSNDGVGSSAEEWQTLRHLYQVGETVELYLKKHHLSQQQSNNTPIDSLNNTTVLGTVNKQFPDGISIRIHQRLTIQETQLIQRCSFDIRKTENPSRLENQLAFLAKRHSDWCKWPGYTPLLQAFKCLPLPADTGEDPVDWVGSHGKDLDPSQCAALSAALNFRRPIVAVHGPPGSGKTHLLAEYLHALSQQGKKVLVLSPSNVGLYHLMATFCTKFPSAASSAGTFLCLKRFDAQLASKVVANEPIERLIESNSIANLLKNNDEETQKFYDQTETLKSAMDKRQDFSAEEQSEQLREIGHQLKDEATKGLQENTSILFTHRSYSMVNMFTRLGLAFDVVIIDDAANMSEFDNWLMALPTAPVLRLFGDYGQPGISVNSYIGRDLNFKKSLLQRLDEQFGPKVNFHLRRQYRSNAAIQAWSNRAFYGPRAAEPDESVRGIRLDDLLEESKSPPPDLITDPLVLVDLGQLEGEWREWEHLFETDKGRKSNWAEAFLVAAHLRNLFQHCPLLCPSKIACLLHFNAHQSLIKRIFDSLYQQHLPKYGQVRLDLSMQTLQGQQFDVLLKCSVAVPGEHTFVDAYPMKHLSNEMCRARRQFLWFANSNWLEQGSKQSRQLLQTFRRHGHIIGPNELMPLGRGQLEEMARTVEESYWNTDVVDVDKQQIGTTTKI